MQAITKFKRTQAIELARELSEISRAKANKKIPPNIVVDPSRVEKKAYLIRST